MKKKIFFVFFGIIIFVFGFLTGQFWTTIKVFQLFPNEISGYLSNILIDNKSQKPRVYTPGPNIIVLRNIKLPKEPTDDQVRNYIKDIMLVSQSQRSFSDTDPQINMLTSIGSKRLNLLVEVYSNTSAPDYHALKAILRLVSDKNKELILKSLLSKKDLVEVIVKKGWVLDAKDILKQELELGPDYLPFEWIKAVAILNDPNTYDALKAYLLNGSNPVWTYKYIHRLPNINLEDVIKKRWEKEKLEDEWRSRGFAKIAAKHGNLDAMLFLVDMLTDKTEETSQVSQIRGTVLSLIEFRGTNQGIYDWFQNNKNNLFFDTESEIYILEN